MASLTASLTERQKHIYNFLSANHVGVLTTVDPNGDPHGSVIYHTVNEHFEVSFLTKAATKKYDNIKHNDHVMLVIFEPSFQTVVQVIGRAFEIKDNHALNDIAGRVFSYNLEASKSATPPILKTSGDDYVAFRIKPRQIRMAVYAHQDGSGSRPLFESIESFELETASAKQ